LSSKRLNMQLNNSGPSNRKSLQFLFKNSTVIHLLALFKSTTACPLMCRLHANQDCSFLAVHWYRYALCFQTSRSLHRVRQIDMSIASIYSEQLIMTDTNCRMMATERRYSRREDILTQTQALSFCFKSSRASQTLFDLCCCKTWIKKTSKVCTFRNATNFRHFEAIFHKTSLIKRKIHVLL